MFVIEVPSDPSWIEYVAAFATAVSAIVIGWQAWLTRRSLAYVSESLREARIARLEATFPRITFDAPGWPIHSVDLWASDSWDMDGIDANHVFRVPRDAKNTLFARFELSVKNEGQRAANLKFTDVLAEAVDESHGTRRGLSPIEPGETVTFALTFAASVGTWIERARAFETDSEQVILRASILHYGPGDSDIDETHEVVMRGRLLREDSDLTGSWQLDASFTEARIQVMPATRTYWKSRSRNEKF